jgi:hypothetical protein
VLWRYNRKLPVIRPSEEFIDTINQNNNQDKILSLRLEANQFQQTMKFASSNTFTNVTSLTVINFQEMKQICEIRTYFSRVTYLSFHYDGKIDFHKASNIFNLIPRSIKCFHIHCNSIQCSHYRPDYIFTKIEKFNTTVESFVLHVNYVNYVNQTSQSIINMCMENLVKCALRTIIDFIRIMTNIQDVRIILNEGSINNFLDVDEWIVLMDMCLQLKKINLKGKKTIPYDIQLAEEMKDEFRNKRGSMELEIQVK